MIKINVEYELTKNYTLDRDGEIVGEETFVVPAEWLRNYWEHNKEFLPTKAKDFAEFLDVYAPEEDGALIFDAACYDGVIVYDGITGR